MNSNLSQQQEVSYRSSNTVSLILILYFYLLYFLLLYLQSDFNFFLSNYRRHATESFDNFCFLRWVYLSVPAIELLPVCSLVVFAFLFFSSNSPFSCFTSFHSFYANILIKVYVYRSGDRQKFCCHSTPTCRLKKSYLIFFQCGNRTESNRSTLEIFVYLLFTPLQFLTL